ncbi:protein NO VEIN domain-containing protein [Escherichia coli]|uniref:protein NO VEIN domain-containing protein n=1 Tax=Escherichia coli TaxID=562 RepID=UPI0039B3DD44
MVSHNELEFSKEAGDQFHLYRVFQFRDGPRLFTLPGDLSQHVHLKPTGTVANSRW